MVDGMPPVDYAAGNKAIEIHLPSPGRLTSRSIRR